MHLSSNCVVENKRKLADTTTAAKDKGDKKQTRETIDDKELGSAATKMHADQTTCIDAQCVITTKHLRPNESVLQTLKALKGDQIVADKGMKALMVQWLFFNNAGLRFEGSNPTASIPHLGGAKTELVVLTPKPES